MEDQTTNDQALNALSTVMPLSSRQHMVCIATPQFLMLKFAEVATHLSIWSFNRLYRATKLIKLKNLLLSQATFLNFSFKNPMWLLSVFVQVSKIRLPAPRVLLYFTGFQPTVMRCLGVGIKACKMSKHVAWQFGKWMEFWGLVSRRIFSRRKEVLIFLYRSLLVSREKKKEEGPHCSI